VTSNNEAGKDDDKVAPVVDYNTALRYFLVMISYNGELTVQMMTVGGNTRYCRLVASTYSRPGSGG